MPFTIAIDRLPRLDPTASIAEIQRFIVANVDRDYARYHSPRYAHLLHLLGRYVKASDTILDMGASELTDLIRLAFQRRVDVLDYMNEVRGESGNLYFFDLNTVDKPDDWRTDIPQYDVVVMAEVFEHLYASPESIFRFLKTLVKPGGLLIVQTPNGLALRRRVMMAIGRHPYKPIRDGDKFGSHVREYTMAELVHYGAQGGLITLEKGMGSYFDVRYGEDKGGSKTALKRIFYALTPPWMRPGITIVYRNDS